MSESTHIGENNTKKCENVEAVANQSQTTTSEAPKTKLSRREELLAWKAQKEAKKAAAAKTVKSTPHKDRFAIVPSAIHQKCKDHTLCATPSHAPPTTPLRKQHAAQASKVLNAHTPLKTPSAVPQTAPRPTMTQKRTSMASGVPLMAPLMTPQAKSKTVAAKQASSARTSIVAPQPESSATASTSQPSKPILESNTITDSAPMTSSEPEIEHNVKSPALEPTVAVAPSSEPSKPELTERQKQVFRHNPIWKGMVDGLAIKLLEMALLRQSLLIVKNYCPREGDDAEEVMEKYISGKKRFDGLESSFLKMVSLIESQQRPASAPAQKPFKTCFYYLYRALFEEYHEQIPEATACFEKAIELATEPRGRVMSAFKHFCGRIRELTQVQMGVRPSLAVGVRKMQEAEGMAVSARSDAKSLVDLLEEEEFEDFDVQGEESEDQEPSQESEIQTDSFHSAEGPEINDMVEAFVEQVVMDVSEPAVDALNDEQVDKEENNETSAVEPSVNTESPTMRSPALSNAKSLQTPSKLERLSKTPLGKAKRQVLFSEEDSTEDVGEISSTRLVYEASKPSKKTKKLVESATVVTPMRRSNRIAQPLREGQSTQASDLLPQTSWSYQPNEELIASGKLEAMAAPKPTPKKQSHFVPLSVASERLAQINSTPLKTPSRMGPPKRVPTTFDDEQDEDEERATSCAPSDDPCADTSETVENGVGDIDSVALDLKSMDILVETEQQEKIVLAPFVAVETPQEESKTDEYEEAEEDDQQVSMKARKTPARRASKKTASKARPSSKVVSIVAEEEETGEHKIPSKRTSSRKSTLPVVEDETPIQTSEVAEGAEDTSLYQSMRKAAFSRAYGSGYIVTPNKKKEQVEESDNPVLAPSEATPARRSRRLANKKH